MSSITSFFNAVRRFAYNIFIPGGNHRRYSVTNAVDLPELYSVTNAVDLPELYSVTNAVDLPELYSVTNAGDFAL